MRKLIQLFWEEPAVALGVIVAGLIATLKIISGDGLTADDLISILAPLGTAAGIRPFVTPAAHVPAETATAHQ